MEEWNRCALLSLPPSVRCSRKEQGQHEKAYDRVIARTCAQRPILPLARYWPSHLPRLSAPGYATDRLTSLKTTPTLRIPAGFKLAFPFRPVKDSRGSSHHSRMLSVLPPSALRRAGVFSGLDSDATNPQPRRPTRQTAWWVFEFQGLRD
jgi:hypothetical protein